MTRAWPVGIVVAIMRLLNLKIPQLAHDGLCHAMPLFLTRPSDASSNATMSATCHVLHAAVARYPSARFQPLGFQYRRRRRPSEKPDQSLGGLRVFRARCCACRKIDVVF